MNSTIAVSMHMIAIGAKNTAVPTNGTTWSIGAWEVLKASYNTCGDAYGKSSVLTLLLNPIVYRWRNVAKSVYILEIIEAAKISEEVEVCL